MQHRRVRGLGVINQRQAIARAEAIEDEEVGVDRFVGAGTNGDELEAAGVGAAVALGGGPGVDEPAAENVVAEAP